jgi:hypothetical protein
MNRKIVLILFLLVFVTAFGAYRSIGIGGQEIEGAAASYRQKVDACQSDVNKWEGAAAAFVGLSVFVGILGITTGVLQRYKGKAFKTTTIVLGAVISAVTLVNNTLLNGNFRFKAAAGHRIIGDIDFLLESGYTPGNAKERSEWDGSIRSLLKKFNELKYDIGTSRASLTTPFLSLAGPLYARQENPKLPPWISTPPSDPSLLKFVGIGESASLDNAKSYSLLNAQSEAVRHLRVQLDSRLGRQSESLNSQLLSEYLMEAGTVENTYFQYLENPGVYRYYTLFVLDRTFLSEDISIFLIQNKINLPTRSQTGMKEPFPSFQGDLGQSIKQQESLLNTTRESLPPQEYEEFMTARKNRLEGQLQTALPVFERIIQVHPTFSRGWHELALTYDALGEAAKADPAFLKALELDSSLATKDLSLVFNYTSFLVRQNRIDEAKDFLFKASSLQPENAQIYQLKKALKEIR